MRERCPAVADRLCVMSQFDRQAFGNSKEGLSAWTFVKAVQRIVRVERDGTERRGSAR